MRLMFQGTGSSVGKSVVVAGLARALANRGLAVLPFKPQNMSNNAAVTADGGEIGRAQWLQARACRVPPHTDMNPVLLKPQSAGLAQLVVHGRVSGANSARAYQDLKRGLLPEVLASFARLETRADIVLVEGAGSASETNLRHDDIANMGFARAAGVPVIVIGDIDRGGVIASLVGTHAVLDPADRALVCGFVVNRMRGDPTLFGAGMRTIAGRTGWEPFGLVPHLDAVKDLPAEDSADLARPAADRSDRPCRIAVPILPHIANFDDLDPLAADLACHLSLLRPGTPIPAASDVVILPGSKSVIADLRALQDEGWHHDLHAHRRRGGRIFGICGGLQLLGRSIADPDGLEGPPETVPGLGLLDLETILTPTKTLREAKGTTVADGRPVTGYEMHLGLSSGPDTGRPFARLEDGTDDGATSPDGLVCGTYLHGIFSHPVQRDALLGKGPARSHHDAAVDAALEALAIHLEHHLAVDRLLELAALKDGQTVAR